MYDQGPDIAYDRNWSCVSQTRKFQESEALCVAVASESIGFYSKALCVETRCSESKASPSNFSHLSGRGSNNFPPALRKLMLKL